MRPSVHSVKLLLSLLVCVTFLTVNAAEKSIPKKAEVTAVSKAQFARKMIKENGSIQMIKDNPQAAQLFKIITEKELTDLYVTTYCKHFSIKEMKYALEFDKKPLGQKYKKVMVKLATEINKPQTLTAKGKKRFAVAKTLINLDPNVDKISEAQKDSLCKLYANSFTVAELKALVAHNKKPETMALTKKMPPMLKDIQISLMTLIQKKQAQK